MSINAVDNMPTCAVLLAAFNGVNWIDEQLTSILSQRSVSLTVYISVDVSSDGTYEYLLDRYGNNLNVIILPSHIRFGGAGRNFYRLLKDVDLSFYDYISFSDQDDIWPNDKLIKGIEKLQLYDCYSANVTAFWENGYNVLIDKAQSQREWDFLFEAAGPGCTYVFKNEVAVNFRSWLLQNYEQIGKDIALHDWLFYAFARKNGYHWYIDPQPMMFYRQHANNQVGTNNNLASALKRLRLIKSNWYRKQSVKIAEHLNIQSDPIVKFGLNNGYIGNLYLLLHVNKLRRRMRDRFALSFVLLLNLF